MIVTKKFVAPDDRLIGAACRREEVQADWWTDQHATRSHTQCNHALASHICRHHCPVLERCQAQKDKWGTDWDGMVIAGKLWTRIAGKTIPAKQPRGPYICTICAEYARASRR